MSAFFSSIKNIADNYGHGIMTIQAQFEDMKFGFMPSSATTAPLTTATNSSTNSNIRTTPVSTPSSSKSHSRSNSFNNNTINMSITSLNATSDFNQWLHAMKMVARLPGGTPPEFRRKLWLALADRYLHTSGIDWNKEQAKCLSEAWLDDDEELGIQIVKDLHRTGSSLFSGPNGNINQAKLKRVLLGYARWNPEVGYCQGFNMLGALILQVMDKSEIEALKVMIYLIEGVLPKGYFSGSLGGLQADMAVFREILSNRLPKLSKHLQKLQGTIGENSLEPPLINVFTMQWFLTLFCTCIPKSCVLRVWDLVLIEGSDILLRTALAIWAVLADRILATKSADEFYCKMGTLSGELLNGHLFDSNGLIQRIVDLGPIADLQKMREKHLFNITPWKDRKGLRIFYSDEDVDSDDESWKYARRSSSGMSLPPAINRNSSPDTRERIALDISLLKKQYAKLRERQRQAHIILTNTAKQTVNPTISNSTPSNVNQYLIGRNAIVSSKGKRSGPPIGSIPPARVTLANTVVNKHQQKRLRNATIATVDNASTSALLKRSDNNFNIQKPVVARHKSESSSYSEDDSDNDSDDDFGNRAAIDSTSSSTSLCDDDIGIASSMEASPLKSRVQSSASDESRCSSSRDINVNLRRRRSLDEPIVNNEIEEVEDNNTKQSKLAELLRSRENSHDDDVGDNEKTTISNNSSTPLSLEESSEVGLSDLDLLTLAFREQITSTSQLSPIADITKFLGTSSISPLKTPASCLNSYPLCEIPADEGNQEDSTDGQDFAPNKSNLLHDLFKVSDEGVTNAYFERVNHVSSISSERPSFLELHGSSDTKTEPKVSKPLQSKENEKSPTVESETKASNSEVSRLLTKPHLMETKKSNLANDQAIISSDIKVSQTPSQSAVEKTDADANSQKNTDRILKIIEENSKILDRIMSKNAQTIANANIIGSTMDQNTLELSTSPNKGSEIESVALSNETKEKRESDNFDPNKNVIEPDEAVVMKKDTLHETNLSKLDEESKKSSTEENKSAETKTYSSGFKYGDMSDYISKYLKNSKDRSKYESISDVKGAETKAPTREIITPNIILTAIDEDNLNLPEQLINICEMDPLSILARDEIPSTDEIRNLLKESFFEYSKSPSEALPIDSKIENDLETLLKMSAELLREEYEPVAPIEYNQFEDNDDYNVVSTENNTNDIFSTTLSDLAELDSNEPYESKRNSSYFEQDANELDLDSTTGDISATISSIKNTIKSIDSLCQDDDRRTRERTDKTLNDIIKAVEQMEETKDTRIKLQDSEPKEAAKPSVIMSGAAEHTPRNDIETQHSDEGNARYLASARMSRDRSRMTSPRRRKDDDFGEYESRARRSKSPSSSILASHRYSGDFTPKFSGESIKNPLLSEPRSSSVRSAVTSKPSSPYKTAEKLEIRHTTVTSTFYDRFLCQKYEQQHKMDRSPSSPVITKAYLNSLKPMPSATDSLSLSDGSRRRSSRSNETSPVVPTKSPTPKSSFLHMPQLPFSSIHRSNSYTRSCENILSNLNSESSHTDKYSYQSKLMTSSDIFETKRSSIDVDTNFKRHSTGIYYPSTSTLPIKPKKPSEIGIKLGLYKPT